MKFTIDKAAFQKALSHGQSVVEKRQTMPILGHVLMKAENGSVVLMTTDNDLALEETLPAVVEKSGSATVSVQMLFEIVRKLPQQAQVQVELDDEKGQVRLSSGRSQFNLSSLSSDHFPQLTVTELTHHFTLPGAALKKLIERTRFAMSTEDARIYLNGIYLHAHRSNGQSFLRAVATDGHRLACMETSAPRGAEDMPGIIIGRKTITELHKLLEDEPEEVKIGLSDRRIEVKVNNAVLSSRLIEGNFPDYERAIPQENDKRMIVEAKILASAVDRVATISNDKVRIIKLNLEAGALGLSAFSQELGNANEEVEIDYEATHPLEIGFNPKYLMDVAQQIEEEEAEFSFGDSQTSVVIKGVNDRSAFYVLMPILV